MSLLQRRYTSTSVRPELTGHTGKQLEDLLKKRVVQAEIVLCKAIDRNQWMKLAIQIWRDWGSLKTDRIRTEFMRLTNKMNYLSLQLQNL